jgi:hypothetical protein
MATFKEFMGEEKAVNRWIVVKIAIAGAFFGALLTAIFMITALGMRFG